ncbi:MAG: SRPBCC family protein [Mycobacteriaceae bacterium]|nr:SRPBCC family protein [Mycobacteriaceae bacterium]
MTVSRDVSAPRQVAWDVVADGWTYSQWVVGNSRIRAVDRDWPAPGTRIEHSIGVWPLVIDDMTLSLECVPQEEVVLLAKMGSVGAARVTLRFSDVPGGCRVEMGEVPAEGPINLLPDRLAQLAMDVRNRECLWRLEQLAVAREPSEVD